MPVTKPFLIQTPKLSDAHAFLSTAQHVKTICDSFLEKHSLNIFNYCRLYDDGTCSYLTTNANFIKCLFDDEFPVISPVPEEYIGKKFTYLSPNNGLYKPLLERFDVGHGLDFIERKLGYIEMFTFASHLTNTEIVNFYMNNLDLLKSFINMFKESSTKLFNQARNQSVIVPEYMRPNFKSINLQKHMTGKLVLNKYDKPVKVSDKELECIFYLSKGMSAKETAQQLEISHRTVETYFERVKAKLGCRKKAEILNFVNMTQL